ncbi:MAG: hypothetical protein LBB85_08325, partial [Dysgonamonadaceae bacterium]|nr:hypothetical protein [Dysgonamonadaceae bacterium]
MYKNSLLSVFITFSMFACTHSPKKTVISSQAVDQVIATLSERENSDRTLIEKGVHQVAHLWQET